MAKRRSKRKSKSTSSPNIPDSVLERARREIGADGPEPEATLADDAPEVEAEAEAAEAEAETAPAVSAAEIETRQRAERAARRAERRRRASASASKDKKPENMAAAVVADLLAHPTKTVSEDELRTQYSYVMSDLRNMGILAAILFAILIALGFGQTML